MTGGRHALILGAGASLAAPSGRPLFAAIRSALTQPLDLSISDDQWSRMAPEVLLSRLSAAGIDIDAELRAMLGGGEPNAVHWLAVEVLRHGGAVWTTNFDELIEVAADEAQVDLHVLLPNDDPQCTCGRGHLVKVHGTLNGRSVFARSEDVLRPMPTLLRERLDSDLLEASVAVIGYAGADIDLRMGLREALRGSANAMWFCRSEDEAGLARRFEGAVQSNKLSLSISTRPDLSGLEWAAAEGLTSNIPHELFERAQHKIEFPQPEVRYEANSLIRAAVVDDFGQALRARELYAQGLRRGPRRALAARALYTSGLIHGTRWRGPVVMGLNLACRAPLRWRWPHLQRLPYLTWNVAADRRLQLLEQSLRRAGPVPSLLQAAANAAKEVDPARAAELAGQARQAARQHSSAPQLAWAMFTLSFSLRWLGDIEAAARAASELVDGVDALAGPRWVAWGRFESGAIAALRGDLRTAVSEMTLAREVFEAAGSIFAFDAWCALIAIQRAAGNEEDERAAYTRALELLDADSLRARFKRDVLLVEEGELARRCGALDEAEDAYVRLSQSPTLAQEILGLLGLGEVQRARGEEPAAARLALARSEQTRFGYGQVHAAITLGLAGAISGEGAEALIARSTFDPPEVHSRPGLLRFCQGAIPETHILCFP